MHSTTSASIILSVLATTTLANPQYGYGDSGTGTVSAAAASVSGVHSVAVGPGLVFTPDTLTAAQGDWVEFTFGSGHSVAQSSFDAPCVPLASGAGVYSGFPNNGDVWRFQVNSTDPIWLYCSKVGHCEGGMSLVVNPPANANRTLELYKAASANANTQSPPTVQGGVFGAASASESSSASSPSGSSTSTSSGASSSSTGNAATSNFARNGMVLAGVVAAGIAAVM